MDEVGELDRVLDEEDRHVVADEIPVAFVGVELDREPAYVARGVGRPAGAGDRREPDEDRRAPPGSRRKPAVVTSERVARKLEVAMRRGAARMDDPLRDPLVVEVGDLLAEVEVLEQRGAPLPGAQRVVGVVDPNSLIGSQVGSGRPAVLFQLRLLVVLVRPPIGGVTTRHCGRCLSNAREKRDLMFSQGMTTSVECAHGGRRLTCRLVVDLMVSPMRQFLISFISAYLD